MAPGEARDVPPLRPGRCRAPKRAVRGSYYDLLALRLEAAGCHIEAVRGSVAQGTKSTSLSKLP